ncbi:hypothetical protein GQ57_38675 [Burkholderia sp. MSh2]|uniref:Transport-associated protein n=1 Tax=Burkholderia paludis TaxID=1506587 RepID=A0A6J5E4Q6_9BURK|nr:MULTISPECIES: BON domain-containing protein [Burkholderia]KEZ00806.1 hypothetical protein GQ57_38675 [Burkholderia sp. MSh2]KFG96272.1 hypothetical protein GQ56_0115605 [Burkholderia paludis]CAB3760957.1 hypothetical protein LMG30113_03810 [Burkholderia paludis]VWB86475.1 transport-associated protein [Burkholderia paludis]
MKSIVLRALSVAAVAACLSGSVYAQSSDATAAEAPAAASKAAAKTAKKANRKLGYAVRKAITKEQGVDVANLVVRSKGGAITLEGTMPAQDQIDKAEAAAKGVKGVTSVSNRLTVQQQ